MLSTDDTVSISDNVKNSDYCVNDNLQKHRHYTRRDSELVQEYDKLPRTIRAIGFSGINKRSACFTETHYEVQTVSKIIRPVCSSFYEHRPEPQLVKQTIMRTCLEQT